MYCKQCGAEIAASDKFCPSCGALNSRAGGNGFWDIAQAPVDTDAPTKEQAIPPQTEGAARPSALMLGCCILCAVSLLVSCVGLLASNRKIKMLKESFTREIDALDASYAGRLSELELQIAALAEKNEEGTEQAVVVELTQEDDGVSTASSPQPSKPATTNLPESSQTVTAPLQAVSDPEPDGSTEGGETVEEDGEAGMPLGKAARS